MPSYRPKTVVVSSTNNGEKTVAATAVLSEWFRTLLLGIAKTTNGVILTDAAVQVIRRASASGSETVLGIVFADINGEYGVSLPTLTGTQKYAFEIYTTVS